MRLIYILILLTVTFVIAGILSNIYSKRCIDEPLSTFSGYTRAVKTNHKFPFILQIIEYDRQSSNQHGKLTARNRICAFGHILFDDVPIMQYDSSEIDLDYSIWPLVRIDNPIR